ncbi:MAG: CUB domain-containing protein [Bdellovibrionales bacterium]|nr:CUB domain-containing protein [Bdellovibrionales bacterium]
MDINSSVATDSAGNSNQAASQFEFIFGNPTETFNLCDTNTNVLSSVASGIIYDSGGPSANYTGKRDCRLQLTAPAGQLVRLSFRSFNLQNNGSCGSDYIEVRNGNASGSRITFENSMQRLCNNLTGSPPHGDIVSSSNELNFRFRTNGGTHRPGFEIHWEFVHDTFPDPFSFTSVTDADFEEMIFRSTTIIGINAASTFNVSGSGGSPEVRNQTTASSFSTSASIENNQDLEVRVQAPGFYSETTTVTVTSGSESAEFEVSVPAILSFTNEPNISSSTTYYASTQVTGGFSGTMTVSISGIESPQVCLGSGTTCDGDEDTWATSVSSSNMDFVTIRMTTPGSIASSDSFSADVQYQLGADTATTTWKIGQACPEGYILIPDNPSDSYSTYDFCVMKFEAKAEIDASPGTYDADGRNGSTDNWGQAAHTPASVAENQPWREIDRDGAIAECRSLNSETGDANIDADSNGDCTYDLMSNDEWQTMAQNMELQDANWTGGSVGAGDSRGQLEQQHERGAV